MGEFSTFFNDMRMSWWCFNAVNFYGERRGEPSQGREDPVGVGEDARSQRSEAVHQSVHLGREREKLARGRRNERGTRVQASSR